MRNYAIELFFEGDFDSYVRGLWRECQEEGISSFMNEIEGVEPHIALGVYSDIDSYDILAFRGFIENGIKAFDLSVDSIGVFKETNTVFLQPNVNDQLKSIINKIQEYFDEYGDKLNKLYHKDRISPHITVGKSYDRDGMKRLLNFVLDRFEPKKIRVQRIALVEIMHENNKCVECRTIISKYLK